MDETIDTGTEVIIVNTLSSRVHGNKRVADNEVEERAAIDLTKDETKAVSCCIAQHDELVARYGFIQVKSVRRGAITGKLLVPNAWNQMRTEWDKEVNMHLPESFLTMFLSDIITPYTSFASSSKGRVFDLACST